VLREIITTCAICGDVLRSPLAKAKADMQDHLMTHSFAQLLRHEIRQDLTEVPEEQRPWIVRDIYRGLLGTTRGSKFTLDAPDGHGVYSIDEALGSVSLLSLWRASNFCADPHCRQHNP
jgi:hypothetical protein